MTDVAEALYTCAKCKEPVHTVMLVRGRGWFCESCFEDEEPETE